MLRRRRLIILLIVMVFLVAAAILTASVVYDVKHRRAMAAELEDWEEVELADTVLVYTKLVLLQVECDPGDRECMASLCPEGMMYSEEDSKCVRLPGEKRFLSDE